MRHALAVVALMLTGCGGDTRFAAGTWQVEGWMESELGSTRGQPGNIEPYQVRVSKEAAELPPAAVFFSKFYGREDFSNIRFENGRVEGSFEQGLVDGIGGHTVPVTGTYARDRFEVAFQYTAFGTKVRQIVRGRLVEPAS